MYIDETQGGDLFLVMQDQDDIARVYEALLMWNQHKGSYNHIICADIINTLIEEALK